jgi:hypothetical protein
MVKVELQPIFSENENLSIFYQPLNLYRRSVEKNIYILILLYFVSYTKTLTNKTDRSVNAEYKEPH